MELSKFHWVNQKIHFHLLSNWVEYDNGDSTKNGIRLLLNKPENCNYKPKFVWINKIPKKNLCVFTFLRGSSVDLILSTCVRAPDWKYSLRLYGIWSWWKFSIQFWTKSISIWFPIKRKAVTTIIFHSIWKEMDIYFCECRGYEARFMLENHVAPQVNAAADWMRQ